ncbi:MAG: GNAT family N-acetyltransferase [Eggerthellaceae bacterium]|nr:GNAT family N-acetyltransferase [Eggerthellaceae bacterium]
MGVLETERASGAPVLEVARDRPASLVGELVAAWEASVRATHAFLGEDNIRRIAGYVPDAISSVETLIVARGAGGEALGFGGIDGDELAMLFLRPEARGAGLGRRLLRVAVEGYGVVRLDVNEQNDQAVGFYGHCGFKVVGRSAVDGMGDPFPLLHMRLGEDEESPA